MKHAIVFTTFILLFLMNACAKNQNDSSRLNSWNENPLARELYRPDIGAIMNPPPSHGNCQIGQTWDFRTYQKNGIRYLYRPLEQPKNLIVFFHGNSGSACEYTAFFGSKKIFDDSMIILMEYPGYAGDTSDINQDTLTANSLSALESIRLAYPDLPLTIWGYSFGTGLASYVSSKGFGDKLILIAPFDSMLSVLRDQRPELLSLATDFSIGHEYDTSAWIGDIKAETLIVASRQDEIIPVSHSLAARDLFHSNVKVEILRQGNHQDIMHRSQKTLRFVGDFIFRSR